MEYTGKNVIITGGTGAIGYTLSHELLRRGVEVGHTNIIVY